MNKVNLGLIGLGRLGMKHAENIFKMPGANLAAVCNPSREKLEEAVKLFNPRYVTSSYQEIIENDKLDGIVIVSSSDVHCMQVIEACKAGRKHIFVEKPIAMNPDEVGMLQGVLADYNGILLQVGHHRRFDKSYQKARSQIKQGVIGQPIYIRNTNREYTEEEFLYNFSSKSGGLIFDTGSHDYDMARWLLNSDASSVYGLGGVYAYHSLKEHHDLDNCSLMVEFANGVMGQFVLSRNCKYGYHIETEIFGTEGCLRVCNIPGKDRVLLFDQGGLKKGLSENFLEFFEPCYYDELEDFVSCILEDKEPLVTAEDGFKSVIWSIAARESVEQGEVVYLD